MNDYLKSFIIGSSFPVVMLFFILVARLKNKNYSYETYTIVAPLYLGLMNMLSLAIARKYTLSLRMRYIVIGIISPLVVITIARSLRVYNYNSREWSRYAMRVIIEHFLVFNVIVYGLEAALSPQQHFTPPARVRVTASEQKSLDKMVSLIVKRGILAPNCKWWEVSTKELADASGVELYYQVKKKYGKLIPVNIAGKDMYLVTDINYIRIILENSPFVFGVGTLKYNMFKSFMSENVGVSEGCPWIKRRTLNIHVLDTDRLHEYAEEFNDYISTVLQDNTPTNFEQFSTLAKKITMQFVFGTDVIVEEVFQIFSEANSLDALTKPDFKIDPKVMTVYLDYLAKNIANPNPNCLLYLAVQASSDQHELLHQIPHWIFPIGGLIHTNIPRLLLLLVNHPEKLSRVRAKVRELPSLDANSIYSQRYLRDCVLETLRLNNPVVTTFRTLLSDYDFPDSGTVFRKGTEFIILNNPVLRDPSFFAEPNKYIPERWTPELELTFHAIMFNQGPQRCPGKELAIFILQSFLVHYVRASPNLGAPKINTESVPQMINPCTIEIFQQTR